VVQTFQFSINPVDGRMIVIEMNPRVSRSSALASKATGFPIAKIAAKLAVGFTLDELQNDITGGNYWDDVVHMAGNWFLGNNDSGHHMIDLDSGGGYDGLHSDGVNQNQGAESTLAMLSTMQHRSATWLV